jgi:hypothetical protein
VAELTLEPYAAQMEWHMPERVRGDSLPPSPGADRPWERILAGLLEGLASRADREGETLIGHIKGLATFPDGRYLRVNVVSAGQPTDVEGAAPPGCRGLTFTLNVLVYGLPYARAASLVEESAAEVAAHWGCHVRIYPTHTPGHQAHHHD